MENHKNSYTYLMGWDDTRNKENIENAETCFVESWLLQIAARRKGFELCLHETLTTFFHFHFRLRMLNNYVITWIVVHPQRQLSRFISHLLQATTRSLCYGKIKIQTEFARRTRSILIWKIYFWIDRLNINRIDVQINPDKELLFESIVR